MTQEELIELGASGKCCRGMDPLYPEPKCDGDAKYTGQSRGNIHDMKCVECGWEYSVVGPE